jgi:hypothetical protein
MSLSAQRVLNGTFARCFREQTGTVSLRWLLCADLRGHPPHK